MATWTAQVLSDESRVNHHSANVLSLAESSKSGIVSVSL